MSTRNEGAGAFTEPTAQGSKETLEQDDKRLAPRSLDPDSGSGDIAERPEAPGEPAPFGGAVQPGTGLPGLATFTTLNSYTPTTQAVADERPVDHGEPQADPRVPNGIDAQARHDPAPTYAEPGGISPSHPTFDEPRQEEVRYEEPQLPETSHDERRFEEPRIDELRFDESPHEEPRAVEPRFEAPRFQEPSSFESAFEEPRFDESPHEEPRAVEPRFEAPRFQEPSSLESAFDEPRFDESPHEEPRAVEPRFEAPRFEDPPPPPPAFEEPRLAESSFAEPRAEEPRFDEPFHEEPRFDQPAFETPNYDQPKFEPSPAYEAMLGTRSPEPVDHSDPAQPSAYEADASFDAGFDTEPADPPMGDLGGVSTEDLQRVLAGEEADYASTFGRETQADLSVYPDQDPAAYSDYDPNEPAYAEPDDVSYDQPDAHGTGLQQFEARYDKHPEISLAGYGADSETAPNEAERPFFHEKEQSDADFLGEERTGLLASDGSGRKGRKLLMVACGLVGALALGGALAFAYKKSGTLLTSLDTPPIIEADGRPVKVVPEKPGGKDFPHKNKLIYDRLSGEQRTETEKLVSRQEDVVDQAARALASRGQVTPDGDTPASDRIASAAPSGDPNAAPGADGLRNRSFTPPSGTQDDANAQPAGGPRKVKTLVVRPDGTIMRQAPATPDTVAEAPAPETVGTTTIPAPAQTKPRVADAPATRVEPKAPAPAAPERTRVAALPSAEAAPPPTRKPKPPATVAARPATRSPARAAAPAAANGGQFVVQVGARKSQTAALAGFADLQQKYPSILSGYRPIIQKADLGSKGVWYRLRIGPLETKTAAAGLCKKLRSAGMRNCLVNTQ